MSTYRSTGLCSPWGQAVHWNIAWITLLWVRPGHPRHQTKGPTDRIPVTRKQSYTAVLHSSSLIFGACWRLQKQELRKMAYSVVPPCMHEDQSSVTHRKAGPSPANPHPIAGWTEMGRAALLDRQSVQRTLAPALVGDPVSKKLRLSSIEQMPSIGLWPLQACMHTTEVCSHPLSHPIPFSPSLLLTVKKTWAKALTQEKNKPVNQH